MFGKSEAKKSTATKIDTLIGENTEITGDVVFSGGLHIDGKVKGNVIAAHGSTSTLSLSNKGKIEGEVRVPNVTLNGQVEGNVYAYEHVELSPNARVVGNVYYDVIEMHGGAEVNGNLVHSNKKQQEPQPIAKNDADKLPVKTEKTGS